MGTRTAYSGAGTIGHGRPRYIFRVVFVAVLSAVVVIPNVGAAYSPLVAFGPSTSASISAALVSVSVTSTHCHFQFSLVGSATGAFWNSEYAWFLFSTSGFHLESHFWGPDAHAAFRFVDFQMEVGRVTLFSASTLIQNKNLSMDRAEASLFLVLVCPDDEPSVPDPDRVLNTVWRTVNSILDEVG